MVMKGWSEVYGLFLKGESDLVFSYIIFLVYYIIEEKKDNYVVVNFSEGYYLQVEVVVCIVVSKQLELVEKFFKFMVFLVFQNVIFIGNWMYLVVDVVLFVGFELLVKFVIMLEFML